MHLVAFVDLDDTLFQTAPKCPPGALVTVQAVAGQGNPLGFATGQQSALFAWLAHGATVIPVTGRTDGALDRVLLPFRSYKVTHHGAVVRTAAGDVVPEWTAQVQPRLVAAQAALAEGAARLAVVGAELGVRSRLHTSEGLATYVSIKANQTGVPLPLAPLRAAVAPLVQGTAAIDAVCELVTQSNQAALAVKGVDKRAAVELLKKKLRQSGPCTFLGVGDARSDAAFLATCDFAMWPTGSEIANLFHEFVTHGGAGPVESPC